MADWTPLIVALLAFGAMGGLAFVAGQYYLRAVKLRQRLPIPQNAGRDAEVGGNIARLVARHFDEKRFGVDDTLRGKLRLNLSGPDTFVMILSISMCFGERLRSSCYRP